MNLAEIPLFAMLRGRLGYLSQRQQVIAQNVANADTAGYRPQDLQPFSFQARVAQATTTAQAVTAPGHMVAANARRPQTAAFKPVKVQSSETTLDGNAVVLEEEMMRMTDARMNYDAAISFYQKSLNLLRLSTKAPGR